MAAKTKMNLSVGANIRRMREGNEWSQQIIAERLSISIPAYSKIETGVTDVNLSRLEQIAHLFNIDLVNLFAGENEKLEIAPVSTEYTRLENDLHEVEKEIVHLQRKIIQLYDEIHKSS